MIDRLQHYGSLVDALQTAPFDRPFVTMHRPGQDPELETHTFGAFLNLAERFAAFYQTRSVEAEDTVILILPQGVEVMAAFVGAMLIGAVPTILPYPTFKIDPEKYRSGLEGVSRIIEARLIVLDREFPPELAACLSGGPNNAIVRLTRETLPAERAGKSGSLPPGAIAFLQHSAGTTGLQKGVALPHVAVLNQIRQLVDALQISSQDRIVSWLPLYHDMGLIACFMLPLVCHLHVVMQSPTDWILHPVSFLDLTTRFRCTLSWLPNFAFQFLSRRVSSEQRQQLDLSSVRAFICTSEPIRAASLHEFYNSYRDCGLDRTALQTSYGMAENTFAVTQSKVDGSSLPPIIWVDQSELRNRGRVRLRPPEESGSISLVSCGRCLGRNRVRILSETGQDLVDGQVGEIVVQGECMFDGYYRRPELTARVLREGWYWTQDIGFTLKGEVYVLGRKDDTLIVGGRNIFPLDVEECVCTHPKIHDGRTVAFGVENAELGTQDLIVIAEVHREEDLAHRAIIESDIRQLVLGEVGVAPRRVYLVPPKWIVKSTAGKPARSTNRLKFLRENPQFDSKEPPQHG